MWDSFRKDEPTLGNSLEAVPSRAPASNTNGEPVVNEVTSELPFIEVGAGDYLEGSPEVLASETCETELQFWPPAEESVPVAVTDSAFASIGIDFLGPEELDRIDGSEFGPELVSHHRPESTISQQYVEVLRQMLIRLPKPGPKAISFSASAGGVPTADVILNLGLTAVRHSACRVLVVDLSERGPSVGQLVGTSAVTGIFDVLAGKIDSSRVVRKTREPNLQVLPRGNREPEFSMRVPEFRKLLLELRLSYDLILIDGPRMDEHGESVLVGSVSDVAYVISDDRSIGDVGGQGVRDSLLGAGVPVGGTLMLRG